jgi:hypothetical protein
LATSFAITIYEELSRLTEKDIWLFPKRWSEHGVFVLLGTMAIIAALILLSKWDALPAKAWFSSSR